MSEKQSKTDKTTRSKMKALPILATTPNYSEAARLIGCSHEQIYSWLRDPKFKAELEKLRTELVNDAISKMKGYISKAVETLAELMDDESSQVRRAASNDILNHVGKFIELKELETRLDTLEKITERR